MKEIKLTRGYVAIVDDDDYDRVSQYKWHANCVGYEGQTVYAAYSYKKNGKITKLYMHRFIMNTPDDQETDHIDGQTLNNRKSNLRNVPKLENLKTRYCERD